MSTTPNLGLALPAHGSPLWDAPLNANFTDIDGVVGGGTSGQVLTSNGPNTAPTYQAVTSPPGTGTVTSVALTVPAELSVSGSPITTSGTLAVTKATQAANLVWAGPTTGADAQPTFRSLVAADIPFSLPSFTAAPSWWMSGDGSNYSFSTTPGSFGCGTGNLVQFWMIRVPYTIKITTMTFRYIGAGSGGVGGVAWYDHTGQSKFLSFDNFAFSGGAGPKVITNTGGGSVTISPGIYILASSQSIGPTSATTQGGYLTQGSSDVTNSYNANGTLRSGVGSNSMAAGILPSSLGTLTSSAALAASLPGLCFEP